MRQVLRLPSEWHERDVCVPPPRSVRANARRADIRLSRGTTCAIYSMLTSLWLTSALTRARCWSRFGRDCAGTEAAQVGNYVRQILVAQLVGRQSRHPTFALADYRRYRHVVRVSLGELWSVQRRSNACVCIRMAAIAGPSKHGLAGRRITAGDGAGGACLRRCSRRRGHEWQAGCLRGRCERSNGCWTQGRFGRARIRVPPVQPHNNEHRRDQSENQKSPARERCTSHVAGYRSVRRYWVMSSTCSWVSGGRNEGIVAFGFKFLGSSI
jgi:hypothetical protein